MNVYRYMFGYETPEQAKNNKRHGWDDEDSQLVYIAAQDSEEALSWGREISEQYIKWLFNDQAVSWKAQSFAYWLEADFEQEGDTSDMEVVRVGDLPDFGKWN